MGRRNNPLQPTVTFHVGEAPIVIVSHKMTGKTGEAIVQLTVQKHRLSQRLRLNYGAVECHPPTPHTHHYVTKGRFISVPFIQYIMYDYQEKNHKAYYRPKP